MIPSMNQKARSLQATSWPTCTWKPTGYAAQVSAKVRTQGWAATFRSPLPLSVAVQPQLAGTTLSIQIPSSYNSVSHIMAVIQRPGDLIDLAQNFRKFIGSSELASRLPPRSGSTQCKCSKRLWVTMALTCSEK